MHVLPDSSWHVPDLCLLKLNYTEARISNDELGLGLGLPLPIGATATSSPDQRRSLLNRGLYVDIDDENVQHLNSRAWGQSLVPLWVIL